MRFVWTIVFSFLTVAGFAQNPVIDLGRSLGQKGMPVAAAPSNPATRFQPKGGTAGIDLFVAQLGLSEDDAKSTKTVMAEVLKNYDAEAAKSGTANDVAAAYANAVMVLHALAGNEPLDNKGLKALVGSFQAAFDTNEVKAATDAQKEEAYQYAVSVMGTALLTAQSATDDAGAKKAKEVANTLLQVLVGAKAESLTVTGGNLSIKGAGGSADVPKAAGATAPGFSYSVPSNWTTSGVWTLATVPRERTTDTDTKTALIRLLPPVTKSKNGGAVLEDLWKAAVPKEIPYPGGMVFRRYVGDRVPAWFVVGMGREAGRQADTMFSIVIVDCGANWQPILLAQTYEDSATYTPGLSMLANFSYAHTADLAEQVFSTIKCPATAGTPLADKGALVGEFHYGSHASTEYINTYTGSTSTHYVSYGGDLTLSADGTCTYTFSSASNVGAGTQAAQIKASGTWKIEGDKMICHYPVYKQWTSSSGSWQNLNDTTNTYIIGGVTTYPDGTKIAVLIRIPPNKPVNSASRGDSGDWFTTKKAG